MEAVTGVGETCSTAATGSSTAGTLSTDKSCSHSEERSISAVSLCGAAADSVFSGTAVAEDTGAAPWKNNPEGVVTDLGSSCGSSTGLCAISASASCAGAATSNSCTP